MTDSEGKSDAVSHLDDDVLWDAIVDEDWPALDAWLAASPDRNGVLAELLRNAAANGEIALATWTLERGVDVNAPNEEGETPFSFACAYDHLEMAQLLHQRGADINRVDEGGGTPLDWAVCHASAPFREWLISVGAKRNDDSYDPWPEPEAEPGDH